MLSAEGCRQRRQQFWELLDPKPDTDHVRLADPIHLMYLANFHVDPFHFSGNFGGYLIVRSDGHAKLIHDDRLPDSVQDAHVDERVVIPWYDGQSPGQGPRQLVLLESVNPNVPGGFRIHDRPGDPIGKQIITTLAQMRRQKTEEEISIFQQCCRACDAGHKWARESIQPGMTELDVYNGVATACIQTVGYPVIVYGDFAVSPGTARRGGPPTRNVLKNGDMFILDYSVVIAGYRCDYTNTLVVGKNPNPDQQRLYDLCREAMSVGESEIRAGSDCREIFHKANQVFEREHMAEHFPHHLGHGLGLTHPEAPYLVRHATDTLMAGDIITLEPGLYVDGIGGIRIENNYLITENGYKKLSGHDIVLC